MDDSLSYRLWYFGQLFALLGNGTWLYINNLSLLYTCASAIRVKVRFCRYSQSGIALWSSAVMVFDDQCMNWGEDTALKSIFLLIFIYYLVTVCFESRSDGEDDNRWSIHGWYSETFQWEIKTISRSRWLGCNQWKSTALYIPRMLS